MTKKEFERRRDELIVEINELNKKIDSENEFITGNALVRQCPVSWRKRLLISVATMGNVRFEW